MRQFRVLRQAQEVLIRSGKGNPTGLTGILQHPNPRPVLIKLYNSTLTKLKEKFPEESVYRKSVETLTKSRLAIVEANDVVEQIEQKIGCGLVEELIIQANEEYELLHKMAEWRVWDELEEKPLPDHMFKISDIFKPKVEVQADELEELRPVNGKYDHLLPIVWIDCEMTGLDLLNDHIIEICALVTDKHLRLIDEVGFEAVIHYPEERMNQMDEWCRTHHGDSGLTKKVIESSNTLQDVENQLLAYLSKYVSKGVGILAGNSVHVDRQFLCKEMPKITDYLTYRIIDVSSVMEISRRHNPRVNDYSPEKVGAHTARSDILESINQLKYYRDVYFKGPGEVDFGSRKRRHA
ncbi:hypothetical protein KL929_003923 [Ogataea haglerorum]|nr:hypothetical protein KL929_003923 [Ogataea haglerorum]